MTGTHAEGKLATEEEPTTPSTDGQDVTDSPDEKAPEKEPVITRQPDLRPIQWRNPFLSRLYLNIAWSLIPPTVLAVLLSDRLLEQWTRSAFAHSSVILVIVLLVTGAICATILRPLNVLLRAQHARLRGDRDGSLIPLKYDRGDEIGDLMRAHNQMLHGLWDAEERFRGLVEGLDAIVYEANAASRRFTYVSPRIKDLLGYGPDLWISDPGTWVQHVHADDRARAVRKWLGDAVPGVIHEFEYRMLTADGRVVWLRDIMHAVDRVDPKSGGRYRQLTGFMVDITSKKQTEAELAGSREQYRTTLNHMGDGIHVVDRDLRIQLVNDHLIDWMIQLGLTGDLVGKTIEEAFPFAYQKSVPEYRHVLLSGKSLVTEEKTMIGEQELITETRKIPVFENGEVVRIITVLRDITARRVAEEAIQTAHTRLHLALHSTGAGVFDCHRNNPSESYYSDELKVILGDERLSAADGPFDAWLAERVHPADAQMVHTAFDAVVKGQSGSLEFETRVRRADGHTVYLWVNGRPVERDADGHATRIVGVVQNVTDWARTRNQLRRSHAQYRSTIEAMQDSVLLLDRDYEILLANEKFRRGHPVLCAVQEPVGMNFFDALPVVDDSVRGEFEEAARTGKPFLSERTYNLAGDDRHYEVTKIPVFSGDDVSHFVVMARDVTEHRQAEESVRRERDRAQLYLDIAGNLIVALNAEGRITMINETACSLLGYTQDELLGQSWFDTCVPQDRADDIRAVFETGINGESGGAQVYENAVLTRAGETRQIFWRNSWLRDHTGKVTGTLSSGLDITEMQRVKDQLRDQKDLLFNLINTIPNYVFWKDRESRYLGCNMAFAKAAGLGSPDDVVGKTDYDMSWKKEESDDYRQCDAALIASGKPILNIKETQRTAQGETIDILTNRVPLRDADGRVFGVLGVYADVTELRHAEEELRAKTEELGERVKELRCLNDIARLLHTQTLTLDEVLQCVTDITPQGWQHPPATHARLVYLEREYRSDAFEESPYRIMRDLVVNDEIIGHLEVHRVMSPNDELEQIFLSEENTLLDAIVVFLSNYITRARSEEGLRRANRFLDSVIENIPHVVFVKEAQTLRFLRWNQGASRLTGIPQEEILGRTDFDFFSEEEASFYTSKDREVIANRQPVDIPEETIQTRHRGSATLHTRKVPICDDDGTPLYLLGIAEDITARKKAEQMLRLVQFTMDHSSDAVYWLDADGRFAYINEQMSRTLGYTKDELLTMTIYDVSQVVTPELFAQRWKQVQEAGRLSYESTHRGKDGHQVPVEITSSFINFEGRELNCAFARDITERKAREKMLQFTTQAVEDASEAIYWMRLDGSFAYVNQRACEALGYSRDELLSMNVLDIDPNLTAEIWDKIIADLLENGEFSTESNHRRRDGSVFPMEMTSRLVPFEGEPYLIAIVRDVTERRATEEARQKQLSFLQRLIDTIPNPVFFKDYNGMYEFCNRSFSELLHVPADAIVGKTVRDVLVSSEAEMIEKKDEQLISKGETLTAEEPMRLADGQHIIKMHKTPMQSMDGERPGILTVLTDMTEIRETERLLRESHDRQSAILSTIQTGLVLLDAATKTVTDLNMVAARMIGKSREELLGIRCEEFICSQDCAHCPLGEDGFPVQNEESVLTTAAGQRIPIIKTATSINLSGNEYILESFLDISDRKLAEEALAQSEEHYRALFENALDMVSVLGVDRHFKYVSPSVSRCVGWSTEELLSADVLTLIHPDHVELAKQKIREAMQDPGNSVTFRLRMRHQNGSYRLIEGTGKLLTSGSSMKGIVINSRDITERDAEEQVEEVLSRISSATNITENLEDLLQFAHRQIARLMDATNFYVALYDANKGTYTFPYFVDEQDDYDSTTQFHLEKSLTDYVRRTGQPLLANRESEQELIENGELDLIGAYSPVWLGVPLRTLGEVFGVMAVQSYDDGTRFGERERELMIRMADRVSLVIERKRTEDERKRLAIAVEQAAEAIVITDTSGVIQYVNPAFERATGYTRAEVVNENPHILKSGQHDKVFYQELWSTILSGKQWSGRFFNRRKDGTIYQEDATISPVRDASGQIVNFVAVKRDITQELLMESQLRQAQKLEAVGSLAAGIAHEINTPIQFVGDNVRFMSDSFQDLMRLLAQTAELAQSLADRPELKDVMEQFIQAQADADVDYLREEVPRAIEQTMDGVSRVATIVRAMKDFSHPDKGERAPADINRALLSTLTVARNELKYVADVVTEFEPELPFVWCHLSDLNQVFLNMLVNAAHAIADMVGTSEDNKGTITVRTRQDGDDIVVEIADTGKGIPEAIRERVFDPFFTTKPVGKGTGQGLAIAHAIVVEKHGGELTLESDEGKGTTFFVRLPINSRELVEAE